MKPYSTKELLKILGEPEPSIVIALRLCDSLKKYYPKLDLKPPNDIYKALLESLQSDYEIIKSKS